jgi:hypothetical protein
MNKEQSSQMFGVDSIGDWLDDISCAHSFTESGKATMAISLLIDAQILTFGDNGKAVRLALNRVKYLLDLSPREELERRTVGKLMRYLGSKGFEIVAVIDEEETYNTGDPATAMGHIFAVEEASLRVRKAGFDEHGIHLIPGNGEDIIVDYNYSAEDHDGFASAMANFEQPEELV